MIFEAASYELDLFSDHVESKIIKYNIRELEQFHRKISKLSYYTYKAVLKNLSKCLKSYRKLR